MQDNIDIRNLTNESSAEEQSKSPENSKDEERQAYPWMVDLEKEQKKAERSKSPPKVKSPEKKIVRITKHLDLLEKEGEIDKLRKDKLMNYIKSLSPQGSIDSKQGNHN